MTEKSTPIPGELRILTRHSIIYGLGNLLNRFVAFLLLPIYTRYLTPADYGSLELIALATELIGIVLSARLSRAVYRFYFEFEDQMARNAVVSTAIITFGLIGLIGVLLLMPSTGLLASWLLDSKEYATYFQISFVSLWLNTTVGIGQYYYQAARRSVAYVGSSVTRLLVTIIFNIYFIVWLGLGVKGILYGNMIGAGAAFLVVVPPTLRRIGIRLSPEAFRGMLRYGLPLIPGALANLCVLVSDRFFVKHFVSLSATGIYALSCKFGILPNSFVAIPFFQVWSARRFELMREEDANERMGRTVTYFLLILTFLGTAISILVGDLLRIMADPRFWPAAQYVPVLILAYTIYSTFNVFVVPILASKRTVYLSYIDILNGIVNVGLNLVLISQLGAWGACVATLVSYTMRVATTYWVGKRISPIYFEFWRFCHMLAIGGLLYFLSAQLPLPNGWSGLAIRVPIVLLYPLILVVSRFFTTEEVGAAKRLWELGRKRIHRAGRAESS